MRYAFFLILLVTVNCSGQLTIVQGSSRIYRGSIYSGVETLIQSEDKKAPLMQIMNDSRAKTIAYVNPDSSIVIIDTLETIKQLIKHIQHQDQVLNGTMKELAAAYRRNRQIINSYNQAQAAQKKAWKELMDKLTVKK